MEKLLENCEMGKFGTRQLPLLWENTCSDSDHHCVGKHKEGETLKKPRRRNRPECFETIVMGSSLRKAKPFIQG